VECIGRTELVKLVKHNVQTIDKNPVCCFMTSSVHLSTQLWMTIIFLEFLSLRYYRTVLFS